MVRKRCEQGEKGNKLIIFSLHCFINKKDLNFCIFLNYNSVPQLPLVSSACQLACLSHGLLSTVQCGGGLRLRLDLGEAPAGGLRLAVYTTVGWPQSSKNLPALQVCWRNLLGVSGPFLEQYFMEGHFFVTI